MYQIGILGLIWSLQEQYQIAVQTICLERTANQNKTALKGNELKRFVLDTGWTEAWTELRIVLSYPRKEWIYRNEK